MDETNVNGESAITITHIRFEHDHPASGIGVGRPRLSWSVETTATAWRQTGYEIEAYSTDGTLRSQTGRVDSDQSVLAPWPFPPLASREKLMIRVRVWGPDETPSAWSALASVEAGLLSPDDWSARFITPSWEEDLTRAQPAPLLRRDFDVHAGLTKARL
ncbi:MAG TPA: hypothetical protein VKR06_08855, partial [Ktedonosporobacter sp.]|nr:hypothetical protein [Ktedonosporobacter sp.]